MSALGRDRWSSRREAPAACAAGRPPASRSRTVPGRNRRACPGRGRPGKGLETTEIPAALARGQKPRRCRRSTPAASSSEPTRRFRWAARAFHKPADRAKRRAPDRRALRPDARAALGRRDRSGWRGLSSRPFRPPGMTMRPLSAAMIETYLDAAGTAVLSSVGAYQLESVGIHLFERIEGDHFTILGLPLLPLLGHSAPPGRIAVMTFVLGLTGSIGMGKSATAAMFRAPGVPVHDADAGSSLYRGAAVAPVEAAFPGASRRGAIDRAAWPGACWATTAAIKRLEAIVHPLVRRRRGALPAERRSRQRAARRSRHPAAVRDRRRAGRCDAVDRGLRAGGCAKAARAGPPGHDPGAVSRRSSPGRCPIRRSAAAPT